MAKLNCSTFLICVFLYFCHKSCIDAGSQSYSSISLYSVPPATFTQVHSFHFQEEIMSCWLTISLPLPVEVWQPARQGEAYVIPLAEQTGSQCLTEQEHPMLHCDSKVWWSYDTWGALVSEGRKRTSVKCSISDSRGHIRASFSPLVCDSEASNLRVVAVYEPLNAQHAESAERGSHGHPGSSDNAQLEALQDETPGDDAQRNGWKVQDTWREMKQMKRL